MEITVCIRAGIAKIFAYRDPCSHNKIVRILGATYAPAWALPVPVGSTGPPPGADARRAARGDLNAAR